MWRRSIVFKTAFYSAAFSLIACAVVSFVLFQMQKSIFERRVVQEAEENIAKVSRYFLGYFYNQGNWVHLEERQRIMNQAPNILYSYIVSSKGGIDLGLDGTKSSDVGQSKEPWEPAVPLALREEVIRARFIADKTLVDRFPGRVRDGDKVFLLSMPVGWYPSGELTGQLRVAIVFESIKDTLQLLRISLALCVLVIAGSVAGIVFFVTRRNLTPIREMSEKMREVAELSSRQLGALKAAQFDSQNVESQETRFFKEALEQFTSAIQRATAMEHELILSRSLSDLAKQVAHDIRSPLTALEMLSSHLTGISEERRILLRSAVARIRDIANELVSESRSTRMEEYYEDNSFTQVLEQQKMEVHLLASLVDSLISEKRAQFRPKIGLEIDSSLGRRAYGLFVTVDVGEFKRMLSNVIDNAVEALTGPGKVMVAASASENQVVISVTDSGRGIVPDIMSRLTEKGFSYEKTTGSGLGLYHAKRVIDSWNGSLSFTSVPGKGTTVNIKLPKSDAPSWFIDEILVCPGCRVVVVDDDLSIHQVWQERLESISAKSGNIQVLHFSLPEDLTEWIKGGNLRKDDVLLVDHEFVGNPMNGLTLISTLGIQDNSILVTSRYEESAIIEGCRKDKIKLIPKGQAAFVPIRLKTKDELPSDAPHAVLVDDDPLVCAGWNVVAKRTGKRLMSFRSIKEFRAGSSGLSKETPVFIDAHLGENERGEDLARDLHAEGYRSLYLVTGYPPSYFQPMPYVKAILEKSPPSWLFPETRES